MRKWFEAEGKYCVLMYVIVVVSYGIGCLFGASYVGFWFSVFLLAVAVLSLILLTSWLMVRDYRIHKERLAALALQAEGGEDEENIRD